MAIITVSLRNGEEACFQTEKYVAPELAGNITPIRSQLRQAAAASQAAAPPPPPTTLSPSVVQQPLSVADEIRKLAALKEEGMITDEEFAAQRAKLLE
jgi:hypothetical protein